MKIAFIYKFKDGMIWGMPPVDPSILAADGVDWLTLMANRKLDNKPIKSGDITRNGIDLVSVEVVFMENDDPNLAELLNTESKA